MTRINVIDPTQLTDQHLMAEYRELPMVLASLRRSLRAKNGLPRIGPTYTLNAGHVKFFYDKGSFLKRRYYSLVIELLDRGYNLDPNRPADFSVYGENNLNGEWTPSTVDLEINSQRIRERILMKPAWYRYRRKPIVNTDRYDTFVRPNLLWK